MIGYAVRLDGSWRCIDSEKMELLDGETFQLTEPPIHGQGAVNEG